MDETFFMVEILLIEEILPIEEILLMEKTLPGPFVLNPSPSNPEGTFLGHIFVKQAS